MIGLQSDVGEKEAAVDLVARSGGQNQSIECRVSQSTN